MPGRSSVEYLSPASRAECRGSCCARICSSPEAGRMKWPPCGSVRVSQWRLRNAVERLRQKLTDRQPYRCHECDWRKWREVEFLTANPDTTPDDPRRGPPAGPVATKGV